MPDNIFDGARQNRILAALLPEEYARLTDDLEFVSLTAGQTILESGDDLTSVYFPTTCIFSLISSLKDGSSVELAMTGNDGLIGIPLVLGGDTANYRIVVQHAGGAYRLRAELMSWELNQGGNLRRMSLCYTQALMTEMAQSVLCNRHHTVDQQLCRWLLRNLDQISGMQLDVTQETISNLLGVRREGVTEAACKLQSAGLIQYRRGHITVLDRAGLESRACECYAIVRAEYQRLLQLMTASLATQRARPNPATLRQRAEARLKLTSPATDGSMPWDTAHLLHELQVHQIELEMHNEELRQAYDEADALREKYADLYDFAPVGYFTLDNQGTILQINLAGAILLGIKRSQMGRLRFGAFVKPAFLPEFNAFVDEVLGGKVRNKCEIALMATPHRPEVLVRIEAVADEAHRECRIVVVEVAEKGRPRQKAGAKPATGAPRGLDTLQ